MSEFSTEIAKSLEFNNPGPLDKNRGPYATKEAACQAIPNVTKKIAGVDRNLREGKIVDVGLPGAEVPHKWKGGFLDTNLTPEIEVTKVDLQAKADKSELYQISPASNTISQSITGNGNTILSAVNDVPAIKDEYLYELAGRFTGAGVCKFSLLKDKTLVSGSFYRFTKVLDFSVNIPGSGQQVVDITSLAVLLRAGYYLGINKSSTSMPYYGIDSSVGFGWYQVASGDFIETTNAGYSATANFALSFKTKKDLFVNQTQISGLVTTPQLDQALNLTSSYIPPQRDNPNAAAVLLANNKPALLSGYVDEITLQSTEGGIAAFQVIKRTQFSIANPVAGNTQVFAGEEQIFTIPVTPGMRAYPAPANLYIEEGEFLAQVGGAGYVKPCLGAASAAGWWQGGASKINGSQSLTFQPQAVQFGFKIKAEKYLTRLEYYSERFPYYTSVTLTKNADEYNSLRNKIDELIPLATAKNQYKILVPEGDWFECDIQGTGDYIEVLSQGDENKTSLTCDSTKTDAKYVAPADFSYALQAGKQLNSIPKDNLHVLFLKRNARFSNIRIRQIRGKYALHADNGAYNYARFKRVTFEEIDCNYPIGIGVNGGQVLDFLDCTIIRRPDRGVRLGIFIHNQSGQTKPATVNVINTKFVNCGYAMLAETGSNQNDTMNFTNCQTDAIGHFRWMVDKLNGATYWTNPATGVKETDPTKVPYCLKLNASGTRVDLMDNAPSNFAGFPDERPLKFNSSICDYWGMALNDSSQVIEPGDLLVRRQDFSALGTAMDTMMKVVKMSDMNANLEIVGVALEANQANPAAPVVTTNFKYAPKGKIAPTKVTGAVTANAGFKLAVVGTALQSAPTTPIRQCDAVAYMNKDAASSTVLVKLL